MSLLDGLKFWSPKWLCENVFTLYGGGGKGDAPDAPDYREIAASNRYAAERAYESAQADLDFRREVYQNSLPRQNQLYDLASQVAQQQLASSIDTQNQARQQIDSYNSTYRPIELQTVLDSLGSQYLSEEDVQQAINLLTKPQYDERDIMGTRQVGYYEDVPYSETTKSFSESDVPAPNNVQPGLGLASIIGASGTGGTVKQTTNSTSTTSGTKQVQKYRNEDYVVGRERTLNKDFEAARALAIDNLAKKAQENSALRAMEGTASQTNSAFAQQARTLARMGLNPAKMQAAAASVAQNQALTNVDAANKARTNTAAQQVGLRTGVANFGRNMPNTAGQSYATSGGLGSQSVNSQNTGFQAGLPYAQFQSGAYGSMQNAAALQQQGALGLGGLMNQSYGAQLNAAANSDSMLSGILGAGLQAGATYYGLRG